MRTSTAGRALIVAREGRRLNAYRDTKGILTIGVGHTGRMSPPPVTAGMQIDEAECDAMLASDLAPVERVLNTAVNVPMTQNEFDAMASLGFNIGVGGLERSSVIARLNLGDIAGAAQAFLLWNRPAVLESRRAAERMQFLAPDAPNPAGVTRSKAIVAARATALKAKASKAKAGAAAARTNGLVAAAAGTIVTTAATQVARAHPNSHLVWIAGGLVASAVAVNGIIAWCRHRSATTLVANAAKQTEAAAALSVVPPSTDPATHQS